jgi:hypothetical protein
MHSELYLCDLMIERTFVALLRNDKCHHILLTASL